MPQTLLYFLCDVNFTDGLKSKVIYITDAQIVYIIINNSFKTVYGHKNGHVLS